MPWSVFATHRATLSYRARPRRRPACACSVARSPPTAPIRACSWATRLSQLDDTVVLVPEAPLERDTDYLVEAIGIDRTFLAPFHVFDSNAIDNDAPRFGPVTATSVSRVPPSCGTPGGGFRVDVTLRAASNEAAAADVEYQLYLTRGIGVEAPEQRARVRGSASDVVMAFVLTPDEATSTVCFSVVAVDGAGNVGELAGPVCEDAIDGNHFEGLCGVAPGLARGGRAGDVRGRDAVGAAWCLVLLLAWAALRHGRWRRLVGGARRAVVVMVVGAAALWLVGCDTQDGPAEAAERSSERSSERSAERADRGSVRRPVGGPAKPTQQRDPQRDVVREPTLTVTAGTLARDSDGQRVEGAPPSGVWLRAGVAPVRLSNEDASVRVTLAAVAAAATARRPGSGVAQDAAGVRARFALGAAAPFQLLLASGVVEVEVTPRGGAALPPVRVVTEEGTVELATSGHWLVAAAPRAGCWMRGLRGGLTLWSLPSAAGDSHRARRYGPSDGAVVVRSGAAPTVGPAANGASAAQDLPTVQDPRPPTGGPPGRGLGLAAARRWLLAATADTGTDDVPRPLPTRAQERFVAALEAAEQLAAAQRAQLAQARDEPPADPVAFRRGIVRSAQALTQHRAGVLLDWEQVLLRVPPGSASRRLTARVTRLLRGE